MTKLKPLASNMTELDTDKATILFSYSTPVAACLKAPYGTGFIKTDCRGSAITTRHINKWLQGATAKEVPQRELDNLA